VTLESIKGVLREIGFPESFTSDQTALTILALMDRKPRTGLLPGHSCLADGARIHDILEFVRADFGRKVAENTRETYRKTTLRPLLGADLVIRHQLSTNDPKTYYRLHSELVQLLAAEAGPERERLVQKLRRTERKARRKESDGDVLVRLSADRHFQMNPGAHSELEKAVVETLGPAILVNPAVVYLGDTASRAGYQDRDLMRRLNLPIDLTESLPDVVIFSKEEKRLLIVEAVASSGPIDSGRLGQLKELCQGPERLGVQLEFLTAFPSRKELRSFIKEIAWGTRVWIADEPWNLIYFMPIRRPA
jgi:type II restriction enzyme